MAQAKTLIVTSLDYLGVPILQAVKKTSGKDVLCVVTGGCSGLDVTAECHANGFSILVSPDENVAKAVVASYKPTVAFALGEEAERVLLKAKSTPFFRIQVGNGKKESAKLSTYPNWPEFWSIWRADEELQISLLAPQTKEVVKEITVDLDAYADTGISLRYKNVSGMQQLFAEPEELMGKLAEIAGSSGIEDPPSTTAGAEFANGSAKNSGLPFIDHKSFTLDEADRFIRGSSFPPHDCAIVKINDANLNEEVEYYIDTLAHYIYFLQIHAPESLAVFVDTGSPEGTPSSAKNNGLMTMEVQTNQKYTADTHWYSNVGGSIVKVQAETMRLRMVDKNGGNNTAVGLIPGQALGAQAKKRLRMNEPLIGLSAHSYIQKALSSGWIGVEGPYIKKFEAALARICQVDAACAVQSGTAALYGAMKALGVASENHRVIVPTYTCAACADAIVHAGGVPVSVDCELDSYGLDFDSVKAAIDGIREEAVETNTGIDVVGVVIAPCYGVPSRDHVKIWNLCKQEGIWLCEDNCESYGAAMQVSDVNDDIDLKYGIQQTECIDSSTCSNCVAENSHPSTLTTPSAIDSLVSNGGRNVKLAQVGSLSTMSVISVRSEKMVGVGEGGAILSKETALVSKARWWCSRAPVRGCGLWRVYEHENVGQNFRLPELLGAVGLAATENLPVMIQRKRKIHRWYQESLGDLEYLKFQGFKKNDQPVWWLNCLKIQIEKAGVLAKVEQRKRENKQYNLAEEVGINLMKRCPHIEIRPAFFPLHKMSSFSRHARPCPNADEVYDTLLCVPSSAHLTKKDVTEVSAALKESLNEVLYGDV